MTITEVCPNWPDDRASASLVAVGAARRSTSSPIEPADEPTDLRHCRERPARREQPIGFVRAAQPWDVVVGADDDGASDLRGARPWIGGEEQSGNARDGCGRGRRTAQIAATRRTGVVAPKRVAERCDLHVVRTIVGVLCKIAEIREVGNGERVGQTVCLRVRRLDEVRGVVKVDAVVAGREHDEHVCLRGGTQRIADARERRNVQATPRAVEHARTMRDRIADSACRCSGRPRRSSGAAHHLDRKDLRPWRDPDITAVVARGSDDRSDQRPMPAAVGRIGVPVEHVPAGEQVRPEVSLARVDAGIEDGDRNSGPCVHCHTGSTSRPGIGAPVAGDGKLRRSQYAQLLPLARSSTVPVLTRPAWQ